MIEISDRCAAD